MRQYLLSLSKRIFRLQFEGTDFISTILTALLGAADHFRPNWGIDMEVISWQTPLFLLGLAFLLRIILAPYFIWKEQKEKEEQLELKIIDLEHKVGDSEGVQELIAAQKEHTAEIRKQRVDFKNKEAREKITRLITGN